MRIELFVAIPENKNHIEEWSYDVLDRRPATQITIDGPHAELVLQALRNGIHIADSCKPKVPR